MIQEMRAQAAAFSATFRDDVAAEVDVRQHPFVVQLNQSGEVLRAEALVIATGAASRWLNVDGEDALKGRGVSTCAACDGFLFRGKRCVVIGGGETAMEEALFLARICAAVVVVHRRDTFRARQVLQDRVLNHPTISVRWQVEVQEFIAAERGAEGGTLQERDGGLSIRLAGLTLRDARTGQTSREPADAAFLAIGHTPNTELLEGQVRMLPGTGYLETLAGSTQTSVPGVFAAGDVADPSYRQAITSAGSGAAAALDAERWLSLNRKPQQDPFG